MESMNQESEQVRRVMGVFAHPDDPEFFSGATFARWASEGAEITFVLATSGDKGSEDPDMTHERLAKIREAEEVEAAKALGVNDVVFLRYADGTLEPNMALRRDITRLIRLKKPDTIVTCDPRNIYGAGFINHPDHRAIGTAVIDAVYPTARDRLNFLEMEQQEGLTPHKVKHVYLAGSSDPAVRVDVTAYIETKIDALRAHKSQIKDIDAVAARIRERTLDPSSPSEYPRHIESFFVITLG